MLLANKIKPGTFVAWDGRQSMLSLLERFFCDNFELYRSNQRGDDFNILRKLDALVTFKDDKLQMMINNTTFFENNEEDFTTTDSQAPQSQDETPDKGVKKE